MLNIIEHAEKFLGEISSGWKEKFSANELQVVRFENRPVKSIDTFLTLGLNCHALEISSDKKVRQELLFHSSKEWNAEIVVSLLLYLCEYVLKQHHALLRGQVVRLPLDSSKKVGFDAVYCALPVMVEDGFATFDGSDPSTVIVWAIPIYGIEADYVDTNGWNAFENLLEVKNPDLYSLKRQPVI